MNNEWKIKDKIYIKRWEIIVYLFMIVVACQCAFPLLLPGTKHRKIFCLAMPFKAVFMFQKQVKVFKICQPFVDKFGVHDVWQMLDRS